MTLLFFILILKKINEFTRSYYYEKNCQKIIIISILLLVSLITVLLFLIKFKTETKLMSPIYTKQIITNVFSIKDDFVNLYLIKKGEVFIAIDTGTNPVNVLKELKKINIDPLKVKEIFLTHNHFNHIAGIPLFSNSKIYLSRKEKLSTKRDIEFLDENSIIEIDDIKIKCIYTPGHTTGSVCYIINDNMLFSGDNFSIINGKVETINNFFNVNTEIQKDSIRNIKKLTGISYVFTAHYGFSDNFNKIFMDFR